MISGGQGQTLATPSSQELPVVTSQTGHGFGFVDITDCPADELPFAVEVSDLAWPTSTVRLDRYGRNEHPPWDARRVRQEAGGAMSLIVLRES